MKRDMELIRALLLAAEHHESVRSPVPLQIDGYSAEQVEYHARLLCDAGLAACRELEVRSVADVRPFRMIRLTWQGHEFLDAARQPDRWQKAKAIAEKVGGVSFDIFKSILADVTREQLGL